jgi:hypothetical protein
MEGFNRDAIVTVFCQGNQQGRSQAAKYAGPLGLHVKVGEDKYDHVRLPTSPELLHNLYVWDELADIGYGFTYNPLHWLLKAKQYATLWYYGIEGSSVPHNYWTELNVAGDEDVAQYVSAVRHCVEDHPTKKLVLFGTSRGASTVLIALSYLTEEERRHVGLAIVEGPFDSVESVLTASYGPTIAGNFLYALPLLTKYRAAQLSPLMAVSSEDFPLDIPLAFILSQVDTTVPPQCTRALVERLEARHHTALHTLELERSHHSMMSLQDEEDRARYERFVNGLYARYI